MLTVKSDDVQGRVKAYEAIVKGENIPEPGVPESFKVLIKELQSLGLDVKVLSEELQEIEIKEEEEDVSEMARELGIDIQGREDDSDLPERFRPAAAPEDEEEEEGGDAFEEEPTESEGGDDELPGGLDRPEAPDLSEELEEDVNPDGLPEGFGGDDEDDEDEE